MINRRTLIAASGAAALAGPSRLWECCVHIFQEQEGP